MAASNGLFYCHRSSMTMFPSALSFTFFLHMHYSSLPSLLWPRFMLFVRCSCSYEHFFIQGNGSDVFGSDICTCKPYLSYAIEEYPWGAEWYMVWLSYCFLLMFVWIIRQCWCRDVFQEGGRALGEVTKLALRVQKATPLNGSIIFQIFHAFIYVSQATGSLYTAAVIDKCHRNNVMRDLLVLEADSCLETCHMSQIPKQNIFLESI